MKKIISAIIIALGLFGLINGVIAFVNFLPHLQNTSIIGGADMPTLLFKIRAYGNYFWLWILGGVALLAAGLVMLLNKKDGISWK